MTVSSVVVNVSSAVVNVSSAVATDGGAVATSGGAGGYACVEGYVDAGGYACAGGFFRPAVSSGILHLVTRGPLVASRHPCLCCCPCLYLCHGRCDHLDHLCACACHLRGENYRPCRAFP